MRSLVMCKLLDVVTLHNWELLIISFLCYLTGAFFSYVDVKNKYIKKEIFIMTDAILLGYFKGVSKKTGKDFYIIHIAEPIFGNSGIGYSAYTYFTTENLYNKACEHKPLSAIKVTSAHQNGVNILVDFQ